MAHNPVNHPLRPLYRAVAGLVGLYLIAYGVVGLIVTADEGLFGRDGDRVFGQDGNLFWSIISLLIGAIVLAAAVLGRNRDVFVNTYLGWTLIVIGTFALAFMRTSVNFMDFSISTVIVTYLAGLALLLAGFYGKIAPPEETSPPRQVQESRAA